MLVTERITIGEREFIRSYSDAGKLIIQLGTGIEYSEALDLVEYPKEYIESEKISSRRSRKKSPLVKQTQLMRSRKKG